MSIQPIQNLYWIDHKLLPFIDPLVEGKWMQTSNMMPSRLEPLASSSRTKGSMELTGAYRLDREQPRYSLKSQRNRNNELRLVVSCFFVRRSFLVYSLSAFRIFLPRRFAKRKGKRRFSFLAIARLQRGRRVSLYSLLVLIRIPNAILLVTNWARVFDGSLGIFGKICLCVS